MESYLPFFANHWQTVGLIGVSLATGALLGKFHQLNGQVGNKIQVNSKRSVKKVVQKIKGESINEDASDEENDADQQSPDDEDTPPILFEYTRPCENDSVQKSADFYRRMNQRRSVRSISSDPIPLEVIKNIVKTGGKWASSILINYIQLNCFYRNLSEWSAHRTVDLRDRGQPRRETAN